MLPDCREGDMHRRTPLGLDDGPLHDGIARYAGSRIPGPITAVINLGSYRSVVDAPGAASDATDTSVGVPFEVDENLYRLRHVDTDWRYGSNETAVAPEEAVAIVERAVEQHRNNVRLFRLLETAAAQLAGIHEGGVYVLVWLRPESRVETVAPPPRAPTPKPVVFPEQRAIAAPMIPPAQ